MNDHCSLLFEMNICQMNGCFVSIHGLTTCAHVYVENNSNNNSNKKNNVLFKEQASAHNIGFIGAEKKKKA